MLSIFRDDIDVCIENDDGETIVIRGMEVGENTVTLTGTKGVSWLLVKNGRNDNATN